MTNIHLEFTFFLQWCQYILTARAGHPHLVVYQNGNPAKQKNGTTDEHEYTRMVITKHKFIKFKSHPCLSVYIRGSTKQELYERKKTKIYFFLTTSIFVFLVGFVVEQ